MAPGDENINIGMPPDVWGPIFWDTMHIVSLAYPVEPTEEDKAGAKAFFESLAVVLPCPICRVHYAEKIRESPVAVNSKGELIYWVWDIHNQVNTLLKKPTITIDEFLNRMRSMGSRGQIGGSGSSSQPLVLAITLIVGILLGAVGVWAVYKYGGGSLKGLKGMMGGGVGNVGAVGSIGSVVEAIAA